MKLRVVIPVKDQLAYVKQCIVSLLGSVVDTALELDVVVVDDGSNDETKQYLKTLGGNVRVITNEKNMGFSFTVNAGIKDAGSEYDYVLVLNSDTIVPKNLLERMVQGMNAHPKCGILGPMSNYAGGRQGVGVNYTLENLDGFANDFYSRSQGQLRVSTVVGLCMLVKKEVFDSIGYFDYETFGLGLWEDVDLCIRARNAGFLCMVDTGCFIHHYGGVSFSGAAASQRILFLVNRKKMYDKWAKLFRIGEKQKIVGMLRVKDGEPWVQKSMEACSKFCDEIVVLVGKDTVDNTYNICKSFPNTTVVYGEDGYNETRDRNALLQMALSKDPDWIWLMDHDEIPEDKIVKKIQELVNNPDPTIDGYIFKICHMWNDEKSVRTDGLWGGFAQCRLYRARECDEIEDVQIHSGSHPYISPESLMFSYMRIKHYGNLDPVERQRKYKRYTEVDKVKDKKMILGAYEEYYCKLYGKNELEESDYYRHIIDETGLKLEPWIENNGVSLCMMCHNEGEWMERLLKNYQLRLLIDEVVVVDNGSTDKTKEILKNYKVDKIIDGNPAWRDEDGGLMNYSAPRNLSISEASYRWILQLDPDEIIPNESITTLFFMTLNQSVDIYLFPIKNIQDLSKDGISPGRWVLSETVRMFKNSPHIYYTGLIHETIDDSLRLMETNVHQVIKGRAPFEVMHMGYLRNKEDLAKKHEKYKNLLIRQLENNPTDARIRYSLAIHYLHIGKIDMAISEYERTIHDDPKYYMPYNDLGIIFAKRGDIDKAIQCFQKAHQLVSNDPGINQLYRDKIAKNLEVAHTIAGTMNSFSFITG